MIISGDRGSHIRFFPSMAEYQSNGSQFKNPDISGASHLHIQFEYTYTDS